MQRFIKRYVITVPYIDVCGTVEDMLKEDGSSGMDIDEVQCYALARELAAEIEDMICDTAISLRAQQQIDDCITHLLNSEISSIILFEPFAEKQDWNRVGFYLEVEVVEYSPTASCDVAFRLPVVHLSRCYWGSNGAICDNNLTRVFRTDVEDIRFKRIGFSPNPNDIMPDVKLTLRHTFRFRQSVREFGAFGDLENLRTVKDAKFIEGEQI